MSAPEVECALSNACEYPPTITMCLFCPRCDKWVHVAVSFRLGGVCLRHSNYRLAEPMDALDRLNGKLDLAAAT